MKFKVGDQVLITSGKDKGQKGKITQVLPNKDQVVVAGLNLYVKHIKPYADRPGERVRLPRPLSTAKIAILNHKGQPDRIGYKLTKDGQKVRVFKKTGQPVPEPKEKQEKPKK